MIINLRTATATALSVALAMFSQAVLALGLGNATVESYLNQPLNVRVDLVVRPDEEIGSVTAGLASAEDFALIGARRDAISVPLRFAIEQDGAGARVRITSSLPVKEPIVRLIVELNWPGGRMLREYTLFLDPPTVESAAPSPVIDQRRDRPAAPAAQPAPAVVAEPRTEADAPEPPRESVASVPEEGEYGPVQSGETLWRIATDWSRGTGLNVNQVMLAIQRNNPQAFINDNINLLKRGAILRMPRRDDVAAISPAMARAEVIEQSAALSRREPAPAPATAAETPLVDDATDAPEFLADDPPDEPEAQLEIVPPSESAGVDSAYGTEASEDQGEASTSAAALREELVRAEEELISERQENEYLRERIAELENRLSVAGEDAMVTDPELAAMEDRLREQRLAEEAAPVPEPETAAPAVAPATTVPQVTTASPGLAETPWYRSVLVWVLIVLVLAAVIAGWIVSRRQPGGTLRSALGRSEDETVRGIKDEAEEILRVLEPAEEPAETADDGAPADGIQPDAGTVPAAVPAESTPKRADRKPDEAELLDEESEDPEVRLDLARAYIAMGDREAARVILAEVIEHGNDTQQAEARAMLKEL